MTSTPYSALVKKFQSLPDFIKVILHTFKMRKKWNFWDYQSYLNHSLKDIREEFNIQLV
ncbi:MAG: hypothetical protein AAFV71_12560 [Cyanobacteria bacterium J06633_8]